MALLKRFCLSVIVIFYITPHCLANQPLAQQSPAQQSAVIAVDNARFTLLTPRLIRLEYAEDKSFNDSATLVVVNRHLDVPSFTQEQKDGWLEITTSDLKLRYQLHSGAFNQRNLTIELRHKTPATLWHPNKIDLHNLGGTARTLDGLNGGIDGDGKAVDLGQGILSRSGWMLLDDTHSHRLDESSWSWVQTPHATQHKGYTDWYFFGYGSAYKKALYDYTQIAGKIPLPPKYAFGYWWSRYWAYSDPELRQLMQEMRNYDIPIDVLVIDMDWHLTHGGLKDIKNPALDPFGELVGWTGYTWNKDLFPQPDAFLKWTEEFHLKTSLNLHPASGIPPMEEQYQTFANHYGFDTSNKDYIPYRLDEKKWAETYVSTILRPLEKQGVDFWWLDWQQYPLSKTTEGLNNTWWLNYVFFTDMENQGKRPLLFHRWGGMGNHRYQIGFSGDDRISWESLKYQTYFTATAANVGYGYWSHDIGGHAASPQARDAELYLRWIQFGILSPIFRTHSAKLSSVERRFWMYPDHFQAMRELVQLRYQLHPYIYTAARETYDAGISLVRPMYYDYPDNNLAYQYKHQYMFGNDILVAPVTQAVSDTSLLAKQSLWLPAGDWFEWDTGTLLKGDREITRHYSQTEIPLLVKAGSIIPMYPKISHLQQEVKEWVLTIVPGDAGETRIYEDAGEDLGYKNSQYAFTKIKHWQKDNQITKKINTEANLITRVVAINARQGRFNGALAKRDITLVLPATMPIESLWVNGKSVSLTANNWQYDANKLANIVKLKNIDTRKNTTIELTTNKTLQQHQHLLLGKQGKFKRITQAVAALKIEAARENWWATLPDLVFGAEQTPVKIQYQPEQLLPLLQSFDSNYAEMLNQIKVHKDIRPEVANKYIHYLSNQDE